MRNGLSVRSLLTYGKTRRNRFGVGDSSRLGEPVFNDHYDSVKSGTKIQRTSHTTSQVDNRERYEKEMQEIGNLDVWREGTL